jgi:hypothetical protein
MPPYNYDRRTAFGKNRWNCWEQKTQAEVAVFCLKQIAKSSQYHYPGGKGGIPDETWKAMACAQL